HLLISFARISFVLSLFDDSSITDIFTLSLHDALPISVVHGRHRSPSLRRNVDPPNAVQRRPHHRRPESTAADGPGGRGTVPRQGPGTAAHTPADRRTPRSRSPAARTVAHRGR